MRLAGSGEETGLRAGAGELRVQLASGVRTCREQEGTAAGGDAKSVGGSTNEFTPGCARARHCL